MWFITYSIKYIFFFLGKKYYLGPSSENYQKKIYITRSALDVC